MTMDRTEIRMEAARLAVESGEKGMNIVSTAKRIEAYITEGK